MSCFLNLRSPYFLTLFSAIRIQPYRLPLCPLPSNIINYKAQVIYNANGNLIEETFVKWDDTSNQCLAGYTLKGNFENADTTIEVSGQAQSFLNTGVDTRVYFIRNF